MTPKQRKLDNDFWLEQLRHRRSNIEELKQIQTNQDAVSLLNAELWYVDACIEHREKHGGISIVTKP
jgi:hypothetical protein